MYNDLLGDTKVEEKDGRILLAVKAELVDDLFALHGEVGIEAFHSTVESMLKGMVKAQIEKNLEKDDKYYEKRAQEIMKKAMEERDARNKSN